MTLQDDLDRCRQHHESVVQQLNAKHRQCVELISVLLECRDWFKNPDGDPDSSVILDHINAALRLTTDVGDQEHERIVEQFGEYHRGR